MESVSGTIHMQPTIRVRFENGVFVPLSKVIGLAEGDVLEFQLPDPGMVYLCETDRRAAVENGKVVRIDSFEQDDPGIEIENA
jgi:predicted DNA-binding antitoxin AbrB/MazE fold protein